jgi:hypothetical protein
MKDEEKRIIPPPSLPIPPSDGVHRRMKNDGRRMKERALFLLPPSLFLLLLISNFWSFL